MSGEGPGGLPPFSRLFVIGDKKAVEDDYLTACSEFGKPLTVTFIKDRNGDNKGLVYIQMSKTSEACKGVEQLNGVCVGSTSRPMKVLIATNRSETTTDEDIMAQVSRLFVVVPKSQSEDDVTKTFEVYGGIKKVVIIKDKKTSESKGLAFVSFYKASDAANAYENCSKDFRAKFADPISRKRQHDEGGDGRNFDRFPPQQFGQHQNDRMMMGSGPILQTPSNMSSAQIANTGPEQFLASFPHNNQFYLKVRVPKGLTQHQLTRLFNIVPTLEFCRLATSQFSTTDTAIVGFSSSSCCSYAKEALHGFEYPPGCPLDIEYYDNNSNANSSTVAQGGNVMGMAPSNQGADGNGNAGYQNSGGFSSTGPSQSNYGESSPPPSDRRYSSNESKKRLFIVSQPDRISTSRLSDMFSKFGNFISVNYIPGKNYGFAKFGSEESADNAQRYMHGETISGNHLKCLDAEDPPPESKKSKT